LGYGQNKTYEGTKPMKGTFALILAAAHVSVQPAAIDAYTLTADRLWATTVAVLALVGVVIGGLALARSAGRIGTGNGRMGAIVALVAGLIAVVNGGLVLATADGGPGTGNGVVGGAAALVLGLVAMVLGGLAISGKAPVQARPASLRAPMLSQDEREI
jgi:hypothetical protein